MNCLGLSYQFMKVVLLGLSLSYLDHEVCVAWFESVVSMHESGVVCFEFRLSGSLHKHGLV